MHSLRFICPAGARLPFHPREIRRLALRMLHTLSPQGAKVELVFVRDAEIMDLNRRYLDLRGPTNCLAFPAGTPNMPPGGSLFVSLDALGRECLLYGQSPAAHLGRLLAHGLAHLAGFEHGDAMDAVCAALAKAWGQQD